MTTTTKYRFPGTGTTNRVVALKFQEQVSVQDFGAVGDGTTDDYAAFVAALATNRPVYVPAGTYALSNTLYLTGPYNSTQAAFTGGTLFGDGQSTVLKCRTGFTASYLVFIGNPAYASTGTYSVGNYLGNLSIDDTSLPDDVNHSAVFMYGTYQNTLENMRIGLIQYPYTRWNINIGRGVAETLISRVKGQQLQIASDTLDRVTTVTLVGTSWTFINISNSLAINFVGGVLQGTVSAGYQTNRVQISDSYNVAFVNGDLEGDGNLYSLTNVVGFVSSNNNLQSTVSPGVYPGTYFVDHGGNLQCSFMDNFAYRDETAFTPTLSGAGSPTYTVQTGTYQRVGKRINFSIWLTWTGATAGGNLVVTGLPATAAAAAGHDAPVLFYASGVIPGAGVVPQPVVPQSSSQVNFGLLNQTTGASTLATIPAAGSLYLSGSYVAATY